MEAVQTYPNGSLTVEIHYDPNPDSPREWACFGTMIYAKGSRYVLGDKAVDPDAFRIPKGAVKLPVYAYIHGGVVLNTTGFSCPWDSAQCGWIYVEREKILYEFNRRRMSAHLEERAKEILRAEVKEFSDYLSGENYGYKILDGDKEVDSCWGYLGLENCKDAASSAARGWQA